MIAVGVERVSLSELVGVHAARHKGLRVEHGAEEELVLPMNAWRQLGDGREEWLPITVTAVLERTAAFYGDGGKYDTGVIRLERIFVDSDAIVWKAKAVDNKAGWRSYPKPTTTPQEAPMATHATAPRASKVCPSCRVEKVQAMFPTGRGAKACLDCAADRKAGKPIPIKPSVAAKAAHARVVQSLPAESFQTYELLPPSITIIPSGKLSPTLATSPGGAHYRTLSIEPIVYIEANQLGFHEANVVKYVSRWRLKNGIEDLRKARFYIDRLIELEEAKVG